MSLPVAVDNLKRANIYNLRSLGAALNAKQRTDAATTSGSSTVSVPGATLDSTWIGKVARILLAGAGGKHLVGWIGSIDNTAKTFTLATDSTLATPLNASATTSANTLDFGTDDTAAWTTAHTLAQANLALAGTYGTIYIPEGRSIFIGPLATTVSLQIMGAGRKASQVILCSDNFWQKANTSQISRCHFHDFTLDGGEEQIADLYTGAESSGSPGAGSLRIFERMDFHNYRLCAIQNNGSDSPWWKITQNKFYGISGTTSIALALGGLCDSDHIADNDFLGNHRAMLKLTHGASHAAVTMNGFIWTADSAGLSTVTGGGSTTAGSTTYTTTTTSLDATYVGAGVSVTGAGYTGSGGGAGTLNARIVAVGGANTATLSIPAYATVTNANVTYNTTPRAKIWLVPKTSSTNAGNGLLVTGNKFGNEHAGVGDTHILIADEDAIGTTRGSRLPVWTVSTGYMVQIIVHSNDFQNASNGRNGFIQAPITTMTPNLRGCTIGPNNANGSAFGSVIEYGPAVAAVTDAFNRSNMIGLLVDDDAGQTRPLAALSNIAGMGGRLADPSGQMSQRLPSALALSGQGGHGGFSQILKTRPSSFVASNATLTTLVADAEVGGDGVEVAVTTAGGFARASITQADVIAGEVICLNFKVAAGTTNSLPWGQVGIVQSGGATLWLEPFDVPAAAVGWRTVSRMFHLPATTSTMQLRFIGSFVGSFKIGEPALYHSREPLPLHGLVRQSPNGTIYKETINDSGVLQGVTANAAATLFQKGVDASRPAASSVAAGSVYFSTDMGILWESDGASVWTEIAWDRERPKFGTTKTTMRENFPNWAAQTSVTIVDQTAYAMATDYQAGDVISTITFGTGGTGWTFGSNSDGYYWAALYDTSGNLLAYSPAVTSPAAWGTNTEKTFAITKNAAAGTISSYTVAASGPIFHVFFPSRGTGGSPATATMRGATLGGTSAANGGSIGWGTRCGSVTGGSLPTQTPPSSLTFVAAAGYIYTKGYNP